jgi:hypothetical protein
METKGYANAGFRSWTSVSKQGWGRDYLKGDTPSCEDIKMGVWLRIAEALEILVAEHGTSRILSQTVDQCLKERNSLRRQVAKLKKEAKKR